MLFWPNRDTHSPTNELANLYDCTVIGHLCAQYFACQWKTEGKTEVFKLELSEHDDAGRQDRNNDNVQILNALGQKKLSF